MLVSTRQAVQMKIATFNINNVNKRLAIFLPGSKLQSLTWPAFKSSRQRIRNSR